MSLRPKNEAHLRYNCVCFGLAFIIFAFGPIHGETALHTPIPLTKIDDQFECMDMGGFPCFAAENSCLGLSMEKE